MSRLLVVGVGPLPSPQRTRVHAPALRVLTFLRALAEDGHQLAFAEIPFGGEEGAGPSPVPVSLVGHEVLAGTPEALAEGLRRMLARWAVDAIVACTDVGAFAAVHGGFAGPIHVDYFGHPMAERQQQAFALGSDGGIADQWRLVLPVLLRADHFSVCSAAQRHALLGELGAAGRLSRATTDGSLVDVVPMAVGIDHEAVPVPGRRLEALGVPPGARVVLCSGGFNTWMDERTLFLGLERVLLADAGVHVVVTGGEIPGHVNEVFRRFREMVAHSSASTRFHFAGWVAHEEFLGIAAEAHAAVSADHPCIEGELGCRNRQLGWLWLGLRVASTTLDELGQRLAAQGLVESFRPGDAAGLAEAVRRCLEAPRLGSDAIEERRSRLLERHSHTVVAAPVVRWARHPEPAPDRRGGEVVTNLAHWQRAFLSSRSPEPPRELVEAAAAGRELAARLLGSRLFRATLGSRPELQELLRKLQK